MIILSIRTDKPEAEIGLFKTAKELNYVKWQADRALSDTIHHKLQDLLASQDRKWQDIQGIIFYKGPGSFTGLRIGASVTNALAESLSVPVVSTNGENWINKSIKQLLSGKGEAYAYIEYGSAPNTTIQKK